MEEITKQTIESKRSKRLQGWRTGLQILTDRLKDGGTFTDKLAKLGRYLGYRIVRVSERLDKTDEKVTSNEARITTIEGQIDDLPQIAARGASGAVQDVRDSLSKMERQASEAKDVLSQKVNVDGKEQTVGDMLKQALEQFPLILNTWYSSLRSKKEEPQETDETGKLDLDQVVQKVVDKLQELGLVAVRPEETQSKEDDISTLVQNMIEEKPGDSKAEVPEKQDGLVDMTSLLSEEKPAPSPDTADEVAEPEVTQAAEPEVEAEATAEAEVTAEPEEAEEQEAVAEAPAEQEEEAPAADESQEQLEAEVRTLTNDSMELFQRTSEDEVYDDELKAEFRRLGEGLDPNSQEPLERRVGSLEDAFEGYYRNLGIDDVEFDREVSLQERVGELQCALENAPSADSAADTTSTEGDQ